MLTKEEEIDVKKILTTAKEEKEESLRVSNHIGVDDIILLCTKLLETNNTLKELEEEVANQLGLPEINHKYDKEVPIPCKREHCSVCGT